MPVFPRFRCLCFAAALLITAACTKPNPLDCADGTCTDPAHPFCDVDGALEGQPKSCIAVACTPAEFRACRGDSVLQCNETGNDYDLTQCEHGCDEASQGCVTCLSNAECANPTPTCESSTHTCRACQADTDCNSEVCDASGTCMDPDAIVYAAPDGSAAGDCGSQTDPCSFSRAFALISLTRQTVKLRAGDYTPATGTTLAIPAGQTNYIDGSGATIHTTFSDAVFSATGAGTLHLEGLTFSFVTHGYNTGVRCGVFDADEVTHLVAKHLIFLGGGNFIGVENCEATVTESRFQSSLDTMFFVTRHSTFILDRSWLEANPVVHNTPIYTNDVTDPLGVRVHVSNSVFLNAGDLFVPQGIVNVDHSTFVNQSQPVDCTIDTESNDHGKRIYSNDLFVNTHGVDITKGTPCEFHYSLMYPQTNAVPNGDHMLLNMDPKLVDIANGNFHLSAVSPAIDTADPAVMLPLDYDGNPRPEGPRSDIGAFEFKP